MLNLGTFKKDSKTGKLEGVFYAVNINPTKLVLEPATSGKGELYYKILAPSEQAVVDAGAAWPKVSHGENPKPYVDVKVNSPGLSAPLYAKLMESEVVPNQYHLLWDPTRGVKVENKTASAPTPRRLEQPTP